MKDNQRVLMHEGPCASCPPWAQRYLSKGLEGRIVNWSDATKTYWVAFDRYPDETTGLCPRHLQPLD